MTGANCRLDMYRAWSVVVLADPGKTRARVVQVMHEYAKRHLPLRQVARHILGLYHGQPHARIWRRMLSDSERLKRNDPALLLEALDVVETPGYVEA